MMRSQSQSLLQQAARNTARLRERDNRLSEQQAKNGIVHGQASILHVEAGVGHSIVDVSFPIVFMRQPLFVYGAVLPSSQWPDTGVFPDLGATVIDWQRQIQSDDREYFTGAKIACRTYGWANMEIFLNYLFLEVSFRNPVLSTLGLGETL